MPTGNAVIRHTIKTSIVDIIIEATPPERPAFSGTLIKKSIVISCAPFGTMSAKKKKNNNKIGMAISSSKIKKVVVSVNYGKTWMETDIISPKEWLFILWEINYDIQHITEIWCRAESCDGINTDSLETGWNIRGICNDSIYKKYI